MTQYYTGKGDKGTSNTIRGTSISKDSPVFTLLGDLDELNSYLAVSLLHVNDRIIGKDIREIQDQIFSISAFIASFPDEEIITKIRIPGTEMLESEISRMGNELPELRKFVIPGGTAASAHLHVARSIARRTERGLVSYSKEHKLDGKIIKYMNRLSSFLFVSALYANYKEKVGEKNPEYK
jgi:cob(I)alamin adenosyltransferase